MEKYNYINMTPFKWFVLENFPFIEADFDALTNWQLFCKLGKEMNKVIDKVNESGEQVETLTDAFIVLQNYVNNYFDNLDVQDEIDNKLDEMLEDGTLQEIITGYLQISGILAYDTVSDLQSATNLIDGSFARTYGYNSINDGGGAFYKITDTQDLTIYQESLNNGLYATLMTFDKVTPEMFGAYGDGVHNDTQAFVDAIKIKKPIISTQDKQYYINSITINENYVFMENVNIITNSVSSSSDEIINNVAKLMFNFINDGDFTFNNCNFETYANQDTTTDWLSEYVSTPCSNVEFLYFADGVDNLNVDNCTFKNAVFDIWIAHNTEILKGIANIYNCQSTGACIFYDSRWIKQNNIYNCTVIQGSNAKSPSHCIYITYGNGMKVDIRDCKITGATTGGPTIDIYHGTNYEVFIENTSIINNNSTNGEYALLLAGENSHGIISNCNIKTSGTTALIYQGGTNVTEQNKVIFNNCLIETTTINKNTASNHLNTIFKNCDIKFTGCYKKLVSASSGINFIKFNNCTIDLNGIMDIETCEIIDCLIDTKISATNLNNFIFREACLFLKNYLKNGDNTAPTNLIWDASNHNSIIANNLFNGYKQNSVYNGTETNDTWINNIT